MAKMSKLPVAKPKSATKQKPVPVKIVNDAPSPSYAEEDKKWKIERDMRTLKEAAEIQSDKSRMKEIKEAAKKEMNNLKKFC